MMGIILTHGHPHKKVLKTLIDLAVAGCEKKTIGERSHAFFFHFLLFFLQEI